MGYICIHNESFPLVPSTLFPLCLSIHFNRQVTDWYKYELIVCMIQTSMAQFIPNMVVSAVSLFLFRSRISHLVLLAILSIQNGRRNIQWVDVIYFWRVSRFNYRGSRHSSLLGSLYKLLYSLMLLFQRHDNTLRWRPFLGSVGFCSLMTFGEIINCRLSALWDTRRMFSWYLSQ